MSHERDCADVLQFIRRGPTVEQLLDEKRGQVNMMEQGIRSACEAIRRAEWVPNPFAIQGWSDADIPTLLDLFAACDRVSDKGLPLLLDRIADILGPIASGDQPFVPRCFKCHKRDTACNCCTKHRRDAEDCTCNLIPDPPDREVWEDR